MLLLSSHIIPDQDLFGLSLQEALSVIVPHARWLRRNGEQCMPRYLPFCVLFHALCVVLVGWEVPTWAQSSNAIRRVDWHNFTYQPHCLGGAEQIQVKNGEYSRGRGDDPTTDRVYFRVQEITYGDLTGDKVDEAVVITVCNTGGTGQFTDGVVFGMYHGRPIPLLSLGMGDRAHGGIASVQITKGLLQVGRFGTDNGGACCPEYIETTTYRLESSLLVEVGQPTRKVIAPEQPASTARRVQFARGRTSTVLTGSTAGNEEYILGARAGQTMLVHVTSKSRNAVMQVLAPDGTSLTSDTTSYNWSGKLPQDGDYRIVVRATQGVATYKLEVKVR